LKGGRPNWVSGGPLPVMMGDRRSAPGGALLDVAAFGHRRGGCVLGLLEGVVDARLAGKGGREELADGGAQPLELGDGDELSGMATNCTPT